MNLKAIIPSGQTEVTVNGLHQWDYGRKLEIQAEGLPSIVEVHFACAGMESAVVRACTAVDGTATAVIPDHCLEQTTPIKAWVYALGETTGATIITITMPIIARTKPQPSATVPEFISDKYTELVAGINEAIGKLATGEVKAALAADALHADDAEQARQAQYAERAGVADTVINAPHAAHADSADKAKCDENGDIIHNTYRRKKENFVVRTTPDADTSLLVYAGYKNKEFLGVPSDNFDLDDVTGIGIEADQLSLNWHLSSLRTSHVMESSAGTHYIEFVLSGAPVLSADYGIGYRAHGHVAGRLVAESATDSNGNPYKVLYLYISGGNFSYYNDNDSIAQGYTLSETKPLVIKGLFIMI